MVVMDEKNVKIEVAVKELKNLKGEGKSLRGIYPFQDSSLRTPADFRVDIRDIDGELTDISNSLFFRGTTENTLRQLELECDELINEELI